MSPSRDVSSEARGPITAAQLEAVAVATMDPLALYRVEGPGRYRHEWIDERALGDGFPTIHEVIGRTFEEVFGSEIAARFHEAADRAVATGQTVRYLGSTELSSYNMDLEITVAPHFAGDDVQLVTSVRDVRDRLALDRAREASNRRVQKLMENAPHVVWLVDERGTILYATGAIDSLLGYRPDELVGRRSLTLVPDWGKEDAKRQLPRIAASAAEHPEVFEMPLEHRDGSVRWVECTVTNLLDDPDVNAIVVNSHDITARKQVEERLEFEALHDVLTGLPNRVLVSQRIDEMLTIATEEAGLAAVLYVDFDGFKLINDTYGHDLGDTMIRAAAARLEGSIGDRGWVARLGGDEFIVVASEVGTIEQHTKLAHDIRTSFLEPFDLNGSPIYLTASTGVATAYGADAIDADEMLRRADMAMYEAKRRGHNSVQVFDTSLRRRTAQRLEMRIGLRRAVEENQLRLVYQPVFNTSTRTVTGVEALLRWDHPTRGVIMPGEFIHTAEETGLVIPIGDWVIGEVCQQLAAWERAGFSRIVASANVSPKQLLEPDFVDKVRASIARANIDPSLLVIEITENLLMEDPAAAREVLQQLASLGIGCAIDDFGMGYSSLSYLANLPATVLKIDRTFVAPLADPQPGETLDRNTALVGAVIAMAHALGLAVVAEGVEREAQLVELRRLGCEFAQGFHLAHPSPPDAVERFLRPRSVVPSRAGRARSRGEAQALG